MITTWAVLQQSIIDLKQRFSNPPRYFVKEDFVYLTTFLQDTQEYLYTTVLNVNIISQNLDDIVSVSTNIDAISNVGENIDLLESIENVLSEINIITNNITALININSNLSELLLTNDNAIIAVTQAGIATTQAGIATTKATEASESSSDAAAAQQAAEEALEDITSIFNQNFEEYVNFAAFPSIGEENTIYVALNNGSQYRWSGTIYNEIGGGITLGETNETAYRGDRGKIAYDHSQSTANPHGITKTTIGLSNADNTSDANKPVSTATQTALNLKVDKITGKGLSTEDYTTVEKNKLAGVESGAEVNNISDNNATDLTDSGDSSLHYHSSDRSRSNHTGTQSADTIVDGTTNKVFTTTEKTKLASIAENANNYSHPSTHSADIIVNGTTNKVFTATEKTKLASIAENAEVNVQPDWNIVDNTQDGYIKNKPSAFDNYIDRVVEILITDPNGDAIIVKNNIVIYTVPLEFNGYNLIRAHASLTTPSTSGLPTVQIKNINDDVDMLSTPITIDVNEYNSYTATTLPVINTTYDDVATGDRLGINLTAAGTGAKGLSVILTFKKP